MLRERLLTKKFFLGRSKGATYRGQSALHCKKSRPSFSPMLQRWGVDGVQLRKDTSLRKWSKMEGHKSEVGDKAREKCNHKSCSEPSIQSRQQHVTSNKSYTALSPNRRRKHQAPNWCLPWDHIHVRKEIIKEIRRQTGDQRPRHRDGSGRKVGFSGRQIMFSTLRTAQRQKQTTNERQVGDTVKEISGPNSSADRKRSGRQVGDK